MIGGEKLLRPIRGGNILLRIAHRRHRLPRRNEGDRFQLDSITERNAGTGTATPSELSIPGLVEVSRAKQDEWSVF